MRIFYALKDEGIKVYQTLLYNILKCMPKYRTEVIKETQSRKKECFEDVFSNCCTDTEPPEMQGCLIFRAIQVRVTPCAAQNDIR